MRSGAFDQDRAETGSPADWCGTRKRGAPMWSRMPARGARAGWCEASPSSAAVAALRSMTSPAQRRGRGYACALGALHDLGLDSRLFQAPDRGAAARSWMSHRVLWAFFMLIPIAWHLDRFAELRLALRSPAAPPRTVREHAPDRGQLARLHLGRLRRAHRGGEPRVLPHPARQPGAGRRGAGGAPERPVAIAPRSRVPAVSLWLVVLGPRGRGSRWRWP